ncbi:MAG: transporter [Gammaproteobacteria bacterium]|nr:MAG: transporter [Gammaproteobacteria bacterium]
MEIEIYQLLHDNWLLLLFLVIGLGYLVGNIRIAGTPVGPTIGVLLAGLLFGHYGLTVSPAVGSFGFALFIFSIGLQAGPSFFSAFREDGPKYIALAALVATTGFLLAWSVSRLLGFENGFDAGLLAGALTSTPTLAGAQDAIQSGLALIPEGMDEQKVMENVGVGYALTYLIGTVVMILMVRYLPRLLGLDLEAMARTYAKHKGLLRARGAREASADTLPVIRAYRVGPDGFGKTLGQRKAELNQPFEALRVRRGKEFLDPTPDLELREGDVVSMIASLRVHQLAQETLGAEVLDAELLNYRIDAHEIVVLSNYAVGKTLRALDLPRSHGCWANGLVRAGIELPVSDDVVLLKGDRLHLVGENTRLRKLAELIGYLEQEVEETDLVTFSFGIAAGVLLGLIVFKAGAVAIGLGTAGGLLVTGILVGYLSSINPTFGRVPAAARYLLKELGLMLLMASIGLNAGGGIVEGLLSVGPAIVVGALLVATLPIGIGYLVGRKLLHLNPALLLGSLTGAMTSTPALGVVTDAARSSVPAIGYAGTYTFANVLLTFAGSYMMMI